MRIIFNALVNTTCTLITYYIIDVNDQSRSKYKVQTSVKNDTTHKYIIQIFSHLF